jgi:hypothetical protein
MERLKGSGSDDGADYPGFEFDPPPDDAADALAVAICHIHMRRMKGIGIQG